MRKHKRDWTFILRLFSLLAFLGAGWLPNDLLTAQVRVAREAIVDPAEISTILGIGQELEEQQRWGEALTHYEEALRRHPRSPNLVQRHFLARLHYDVGRRYADPSFLRVMGDVDAQRALDLYAEILLKIHSFYVDSPNWPELVRRGSTAIEVALTENGFRKQHRLVLAQARSNVDMSQLLQPDRAVHSRQDAQQAVLRTAYRLERYVGLPANVVILEYACAAASALDDYSAFLTASQLDEVLSQIEGNFVGLGIELKADANSLLIVDVIRNGPADRAGLQPGERIVRVDGHSTEEISTDLAADMLKGIEGSVVELEVNDQNNQTRPLTLKRMRVDVPSVEQVSIVDEGYGIGYLQLSSFQKRTSKDVEAALWSLHRQGMRSLILDVRGNPGGLLSAAVEVADKFIAEGVIVSTRGRSAGEVRDYRAHLIGTWRVPLIVLIDGDSASASEIFAGAIRDHRRGTIVGNRSFGKGSVQGIFPLNSADIGIRLTTAKFYSPHGIPISRRGVDPDRRVATTVYRIGEEATSIEENPDPVMTEGLQVARQQLSAR